MEEFTEALEAAECEGRTCPACGRPAFYSGRFDAMFCPACDQWLEETCCAPDCAYCRQRPERPSLARKDTASF